MTAATARSIAYSRHHDQRDRRGALLIEHVDRVAALELLTRTPGESYELYVLRIAHAEGRTGRLARAVKVADLEDHLQISGDHSLPGDPPYGWARRQIAIAQERRDERASHVLA